MPWKFDPFEEEIIWVSPVLITEDIGDIDMGDLGTTLLPRLIKA